MVTTRDIRQPVACTVADVMAVAGQINRLPEWASSFASGVERVVVRAPAGESGIDGERWVVNSQFGRIEVEFMIDIARGVLDHDVTSSDGTVVRNRLRVEPRAHGSDIIFTLVRLPGMTDEQWRDDDNAVSADLRQLAALCEKIEE